MALDRRGLERYLRRARAAAGLWGGRGRRPACGGCACGGRPVVCVRAAAGLWCVCVRRTACGVCACGVGHEVCGRAAGGWARTLGYIFMAYLFLTNPMLAIMAYFMYQGVVQRARA